MRLKELQGALQGLKGFDSPKVQLEQYATSAELASQMLWTAQSTYDDVEDKAVLDLGCGCGMLSVAAKLMGAAFVLGIDIDDTALRIASENLEELEMETEVDFLQAAVSLDASLLDRLDGRFDTVVMNPPFGTKTAGIDMVFLERACQIATTAVYSLHKTSTRDYIIKRAKMFGFKADVVARLRWELPKTMRFHKSSSKDIEVDFLRFSRIKPHLT